MSKEVAVNTMLSHYRIERKLGAGGMGEVYLAEDTRLSRRIALKVLPETIARDEDRLRRFKQEAFAASALNHPNILTIHEFGETDGSHYIATEYIEGETLRHHIQHSRMSLREVLDIVVQAGSALSAAHKAGIIHRDIKPENMMLRPDGIVKVLDFGLAKLTEKPRPATDSGEATVAKKDTDPGTVMGTVAYMSPEQARGKEVDARTDIFSLGVVFYEMIAGRAPFTGETSTDVLAAILEREPFPIARFAGDVPTELQRIVTKCLRKERDERYQRMKDVLLDLKELREELALEAKLERSIRPANNLSENQRTLIVDGEITKDQAAQTINTASTQARSSAEYVVSEIKQHKGGFAVGSLILFALLGVGLWFFFLRSSADNAPIDSIAVLPFQNRSSDADTEYLSDGLAESLIYRLSQLPNLKVSPTSTVFRYKGKETDAQKIGNELGVSAVMTGRILQRGENLTISVDLVDVRNDRLVWGEQYERKMSELLATQREIAAEIANKLQLKLLGEETKGLTKRYTDNNEAYQLYLKGRYHFGKRTKDGVLKGIEYFRQAIKLDPNFALAYARIAESYASMPAYPYLLPREAFPQAKTAALRAIEIDPTLAEAHTFLAFSLAVYDWNWTEAEREFKRAIELDPNNSPARFRYGQIFLAPVGRSDEAIAEVKRALEIEPLDLNMGGNLAWTYLSARQYDRALEQGRKTHELDSGFLTARWNLSQAYIVNGMYAEAIALSERSLETDPTNQFMLQAAGYAYAKSGRRREAEEVTKRFKAIAKTEYVMSYWAASIYAALGDKNKAFAELENAFGGRDWYLHRLKVDPFWDPLRDDPRYREMLKRLNLPE